MDADFLSKVNIKGDLLFMKMIQLVISAFVSEGIRTVSQQLHIQSKYI